VVIALLVAAAFLGNAVNYAVGRTVGPRVFSASGGTGISNRLLNRDYLARAHAFFEQYGGKAVVLSRFVPIVRTFLPFVPAPRRCPRPRSFYNAAGAIGWVVLCVGAGLLFGNVPVVKQNFSLVALGIVGVSVLPMVFEFLKHRRQRQA
jgi:membrane-associated protein